MRKNKTFVFRYKDLDDNVLYFELEGTEIDAHNTLKQLKEENYRDVIIDSILDIDDDFDY